MKSLRDEIPLTRGYGEADLISSEALAEDFIQTRLDFILQSRISVNLQGLPGCFSSLQALFVFSRKTQIKQ